LKVRLKPAVDATIVELPLEKYVAAVVAGEAGEMKSPEALRAMAIAARTYAIHFRGRHKDAGYDLCGTTHCQRAEPSQINARIEAAARDTAGELIWYRGLVAEALYSRDCGGTTEAGDAPYLRSHLDPYCPRGTWRWSGTAGEIAAALRRGGLRVPDGFASVAIARRTETGRVSEAALTGTGTVRLPAESFRLVIGRALGFATLRSDWWEAQTSRGRIEFTGRGEGHGVGLCQRGAEAMAGAGKTWREIVAFYYPGTEVARSARGLEWSRLSGRSVALFTTQPAQDGEVLATAERQAREVAARTGLVAPALIEVRVYPDVESFRNATGEPGWVAAQTRGNRIALQPAAALRARGILESTLRHEMVHVAVETHAAPGLPLWFREGLAEYLSGGVAGAAAEPSDDAIAQRSDEARARAANRAAALRVAGMVQRYGLPAVVGWVKTGLPK
jgi:stage II sporulation protein D